MILKIVDKKELIIKEGIYYFGLSDYPQVRDWEWNNILAFLCYEKAQARETKVLCEDKELLNRVLRAADELNGTEYIPPVAEARERFVYHATNVTAAQKILKSGKLLSATKVYGKTGKELTIERRATGWEDPADFYEYVMFGWGTHMVGDYVVLSENFSDKEELKKEKLDAGVHFYIKYEDIIKHKGHVFDGYHPIKVKDEVASSNYLFACIVPEQFKEQIENIVPQELVAKVHYLHQRGIGLQHWNSKVAEYVEGL